MVESSLLRSSSEGIVASWLSTRLSTRLSRLTLGHGSRLRHHGLSRLLFFLFFFFSSSSGRSNQTRLGRRNQTLRQLSRKRNALAVREQDVSHDHELSEVQFAILVQIRHGEQLLQHRTRKTTLTVITDHQVVGKQMALVLVQLHEELLIESSLLRRGGEGIVASWLNRHGRLTLRHSSRLTLRLNRLGRHHGRLRLRLRHYGLSRLLFLFFLLLFH